MKYKLSDDIRYWQKVVTQLELEVERLSEAMDQAHKALNCRTHAPNCRIVNVGCSCGAAEQFIPERTEFYRLKNQCDALKSIGKSGK